MPHRPYQPIDPSELKTYSIAERRHKVELESFAKLPPRGASTSALLDSMPDFLAVRNLRLSVDAMVTARGEDRPVVWALGAHVVKVGCSPIVIDLIKRGAVSAIAMNGATAIHDVEVATLARSAMSLSSLLVIVATAGRITSDA